jgi:hypothetical protein
MEPRRPRMSTEPSAMTMSSASGAVIADRLNIHHHCRKEGSVTSCGTTMASSLVGS